LTIRKGDELAVLDMDPALNGWAYAKRKSDGTEGYIPISYVASSTNNNNYNRSPSNGTNKQQFNHQNRGNYDRNNYHRNNNNNYHQQQQSSSSLSSSPQQQQHQNENGNEVLDDKQIICSFHRDFIPEMDDLYKYFGQFGKITNKLEIEYDNKKVPLAKIKYQNAQCVNKVVNRGNRQQIPSGAQNGTIHIRVYRSMKDYLVNTHGHSHSHSHGQRQNNNNSHRQAYNNNRKGGNNRGRGRGF